MGEGGYFPACYSEAREHVCLKGEGRVLIVEGTFAFEI